ncbi:hypothetical protein QL285_062210 [Trifolium repens]|nr:hypothetical protein QL285_062210 [Trifolium repens]
MADQITTNKPPVIIPWPCLSETQKDIPTPKISTPPQQRTFAQALTNVCDIPLSQFPKASLKGDHVAIAIPESDYLAGIDACKYNLHGRIMLPKGSSPLSIDGLKSKLSVMWKSIGRWGLTSLGKGFYEFSFSSLEDMRSVRAVGAWNLTPGLLKLFAWTTDFNPGVQQQTSAQVWIRIFGLSQEYWRQNILFAVASSIGIPICTDSFTNKPMLERTFGHYARVLVDVDLAQELVYKILVERKGFAFFVDVKYENLPPYCDHCKIIGHRFDNCKRRKESVSKKPEHTGKPKQYVPVQPTDKVDDVIHVEGSTSKQFSQVNHDQDRIEADKLLEAELNKESDTLPTPVGVNLVHSPILEPILVENTPINSPIMTCSNHSDFVSNTQNGLFDNVEKEHESVESEPTALLVQQDIHFLKDSWANLAEIEEQSTLPIPPLNLDKPPDIDVNKQAENASPSATKNDGFQLITSRKKNDKNKSNKPAAQKTCSITRAKAGSPKPFK